MDFLPADRLRRPPRLPVERDEPPNAASIEDWALTLRRPVLLLRLLFLAALCSRHQRCSWMIWLGLGLGLGVKGGVRVLGC